MGLFDEIYQTGLLRQGERPEPPARKGLAALLDQPRSALTPARGALYDPVLDPVTLEQVAAWQQAQKPFTPGAWGGQLMADLGAALLPKAGATEDQNIYRMLNAGLGILGGQVGKTPAAAGQLGALVFHGSPHKFDKFDSTKIGTGEGAQAYGLGHYLAENQKVAKSYADDLGRAQGTVYKVDLPDEHIAKMLDWDKPLSEQSEAVKRAAQMLGVKPKVNIAGRPDLGEFHMVDSIGEDLVEAATKKLGKQGAAEFLRKLGVPGIRYLDGGSRGAGKGTSNFVVFDDQLPKIVGRE